MSTTDFFDINIQEQDDDTQVFNLVKRVAFALKFANTVWVPNAIVLPSLNPITLPANPTLFAYIRNIGTLNIGIEITPMNSTVVPPFPSALAINLLGPGGIFLLSVPGLAGASLAGGPFPSNVSGGLSNILLEASSSNPNATGLVEYFLGG